MVREFSRPKSLLPENYLYCPGCTHGIIQRLVAEALDELNLTPKTVGVAAVGCSVTNFHLFDVDMQQAPHGRAPAVATGVKRVLPDSTVFIYQGDGDLAAIGTAEIVHAAARGEKITVIFVNNAIFGMTGGQMAPTTILGQKTTTSPYGRNKDVEGYPLRVSEMLATIPGAVYVSRTSVHNPKHVNRTKKAIKKAFQVQENGEGFAIVEVLSSCPTNWGLSPLDALKWVEEKMIPYYPLGEFRTPSEVTN